MTVSQRGEPVKLTTKQKILYAAVKLFAKEGYDAVTVEMIADKVGIKAPSLYKHYKSKQDIFDSILREMERRDAENAESFDMPVQTKEESPEPYENVSLEGIAAFCEQMFRYWTSDVFASHFRRMLTVEQYKSARMNKLYHQYLCSGPLWYTADQLGSQQKALELYAPMFMLYSVYDSRGGKEMAYRMLSQHLKQWCEKWK